MNCFQPEACFVRLHGGGTAFRVQAPPRGESRKSVRRKPRKPVRRNCPVRFQRYALFFNIQFFSTQSIVYTPENAAFYLYLPLFTPSESLPTGAYADGTRAADRVTQAPGPGEGATLTDVFCRTACPDGACCLSASVSPHLLSNKRQKVLPFAAFCLYLLDNHFK